MWGPHLSWNGERPVKYQRSFLSGQQTHSLESQWAYLEVTYFGDSISSMLRSGRDFQVNKTQGIPSGSFVLGTCLLWVAYLPRLTLSGLVLMFLKWHIEGSIKRRKFLIKERESSRGEGQETRVVCLWGRNSGPAGSGALAEVFRRASQNTIVDRAGCLWFPEQTIYSEANRAFCEV